MRRGFVIALNVMLILGSIACLGSQAVTGGAQDTDSPIITPTAHAIITPTPLPEGPGETDSGPQMPLMLYFDVPESIELAPLIPIPMIIFGNDPIQQATVEVEIVAMNFGVRDENPDMPGTQIMPGAMPEGATVLQNAVGEDGILRYQVSGLGASSQLTRTLLTFHLESASPAPEILRFNFIHAALSGEGGAPLEVQTQSTWVEVVPATGESPTPTAIAQPTLTAQPTLVPPPTEEVTVTWESSNILPGVYYRIQQGQTLFRVAEAFDVKVEALAAANGIVDVTQVHAGTLLHVPTTPPHGQAAYFVAPRETLYSIARQFGVTVEVLAGYNQLPPPYRLQAGQWVILVP